MGFGAGVGSRRRGHDATVGRSWATSGLHGGEGGDCEGVEFVLQPRGCIAVAGSVVFVEGAFLSFSCCAAGGSGFVVGILAGGCGFAGFVGHSRCSSRHVESSRSRGFGVVGGT
mmetsp:Transcript_36636/g.118343  ORF Transcript_36636/g.118343 Transcript_36636/m.118343 type:complete len:114 (-) Transcript_36636:523-864(-)